MRQINSIPIVGFIGLGKMGAPMASRLLESGYEVRVWNRSAHKAQALVEQGAILSAMPIDAVRGADITILMLANGSAVSEVLFEQRVGYAVPTGSIVIDMSSIPPALAVAHSTGLARRGVHHLDAPVSGGVTGAKQGSLAIMVGGAPSIFDLAKPLLERLGRPSLIGASGAGQLTKLANQAIVAGTICAVAEALLLVTAAGVNPRTARDALLGGFADSMILKLHGERMVEREWTPGGTTCTHVKDLLTLMEVASELGVNLPISSEVTRLFGSSVSAGFGHLDHSAVLLELERINSGGSTGHLRRQLGEPQ